MRFLRFCRPEVDYSDVVQVSMLCCACTGWPSLILQRATETGVQFVPVISTCRSYKAEGISVVNSLLTILRSLKMHFAHIFALNLL